MSPSRTFERSHLLVFFLSCSVLLLLWNGFGPSQDQGFDNNLRKRTYDDTKCDPLAAVAVLKGASAVNGTLNFWQASHDNATHITGTIQGLDKNSLRGMHIHTFGDLTNGCNSTGLHYNPFNVTHGGAGDNEGHVGDLGNIQADENGLAVINIWSHKIRLEGPYSVVGRAVVVHSGTDDLGTKGDAGSLSTGNSGSRAACGIIGIADSTAPATPK